MGVLISGTPRITVRDREVGRDRVSRDSAFWPLQKSKQKVVHVSNLSDGLRRTREKDGRLAPSGFAFDAVALFFGRDVTRGAVLAL